MKDQRVDENKGKRYRLQAMQKFHYFFLFLLWLFVHLLLFRYLGIRDNLFDAKHYIDSANFLLQHGKLEVSDDIFYALPILLIAFFKWFSGGVIGFVVFQCILSGVATVSLYLSGAKIFDNKNAGFFSGVIFLCWWDVIHWNTVVMTDSIGCSMVCFVIYVLAYFNGSVKHYIGLVFLLLICFFIRPTGVLIIVGVVGFLLNYHWKSLARRPAWKILLIIFLMVTSYLSAALLFSKWDFTEQYRKGNIVTYMDTIEGMPLYESSLRVNTMSLEFPAPEKPPIEKMVYFVVHNPLHFLKSFGLKVFYLLSGIRPYYSFLHNLYSILWLALIYFLFYSGWRNSINQPVRIFSLVVLLSNCVLIGIATIDWDNRFYIPMQPGIVLLAGGGAACLIQYFKRKPIKYAESEIPL